MTCNTYPAGSSVFFDNFFCKCREAPTNGLHSASLAGTYGNGPSKMEHWEGNWLLVGWAVLQETQNDIIAGLRHLTGAGQ